MNELSDRELLVKIASAVERLDTRMSGLEARVSALETDLKDTREEMKAYMTIIKETIDGMDERLATIEQLIAYQQDKWLEHDKEIWRIKRKA